MTDQTASGEAPLRVDRHAVGVWATDFEIVAGDFEVTLDFLRVDRATGRRYLAARVALPPTIMGDLESRLKRAQEQWGGPKGRVR